MRRYRECAVVQNLGQNMTQESQPRALYGPSPSAAFATILHRMSDLNGAMPGDVAGCERQDVHHVDNENMRVH
jgi:hypothetical protein